MLCYQRKWGWKINNIQIIIWTVTLWPHFSFLWLFIGCLFLWGSQFDSAIVLWYKLCFNALDNKQLIVTIKDRPQIKPEIHVDHEWVCLSLQPPLRSFSRLVLSQDVDPWIDNVARLYVSMEPRLWNLQLQTVDTAHLSVPPQNVVQHLSPVCCGRRAEVRGQGRHFLLLCGLW